MKTVKNPKPKKIKANLIIDLAQYNSENMKLISISTTHGNELLLLYLTGTDDYYEIRNGARFPKIKTHSHNYLIFKIKDSNLVRYDIKNQNYNYHFVQMLPENEILLVCARSQLRSKNDYDLNAKVFSTDGKLKREFLLGDGINNIQTNSNGEIWVSYFDEGIFGNFGWGNFDGENPIGNSGLIQSDKNGKFLYKYSPDGNLDIIEDCYALNLVSEKEIWCCYYSQFPLVCIRDNKIYDYWNCQIKGADGFLIFNNYAFFRGGYDKNNTYSLFELNKNHKMKAISKYKILDEMNKTIHTNEIFTRGNLMYLLNKTKCYLIDFKNII